MTPAKKICIVACGGHGTRMGGDTPKQFLRLGEKTILQLTLEKVIEAVPGVKIVLALPGEYVDFWKEECKSRRFEYPQRIVNGGITRFHSVRNALETVPDDAIVAIHDAARPFASAGLIRELFTLAENFPAVVPVIPVTDTLKVLDKDLTEIPGQKADRSILYGAQTPQVFQSEALLAAYRQPYDLSFTDDASVMAAAGYHIHYTLGERYNIKITTPEDFQVARKLF